MSAELLRVSNAELAHIVRLHAKTKTLLCKMDVFEGIVESWHVARPIETDRPDIF
jgi:hypothetical protein